jgi:hypothetical protein
MELSGAVVIFDVIVWVVLAVDFWLVSRKNTAVLAKIPAVLLAVILLGLLLRVERRLEFTAVASTVMLTALFGYANLLAFLKRGITFSILINHARPWDQRRPDRDFITLADRIEEMQSHGWLERVEAGWRLTSSGRRVLHVRRALLRMLRIEAVG